MTESSLWQQARRAGREVCPSRFDSPNGSRLEARLLVLRHVGQEVCLFAPADPKTFAGVVVNPQSHFKTPGLEHVQESP